MGNISITSVENLINDYPITPSFSNDGMILGISYEDSLIVKNYDPVPLCRIFYSTILENTCIETIIDVVNENYENVIAINNTESCISNVSVEHFNGNSFSIYPNPATNLIELKLNLDNMSDVNISINNMVGQVLFKEDLYSKDLYKKINIEDYPNGVYLIKVCVNDAILTKQLIIEK